MARTFKGVAAGSFVSARAPGPERFAAELSGTERTVAECHLAEVLDRQGEDVRRLLLRTSLLDRVNGELADLLTGGSGGAPDDRSAEQGGAGASLTLAPS